MSTVSCECGHMHWATFCVHCVMSDEEAIADLRAELVRSQERERVLREALRDIADARPPHTEGEQRSIARRALASTGGEK